MPALSPKRLAVPTLSGLHLLHRGKVRDTYDLGNRLLLVVASNGLSIFDFVLNAMVDEKGAILTALNHFWLTQLEEIGIKTHLIAAGSAIDAYLPEELRGNPELQSRALVVRQLKMAPIEFIARQCLTGSGFKDYQKNGEVCGHKLPLGIQDSDALPAAIDTPTTKAEEGHDMPLDADEIRTQYPEETTTLFEAFAHIAERAFESGIVLADTKMEFGRDQDGILYLADEVGTPDSSRFWDRNEWLAGRKKEARKAPPPNDKQLVREWGIEQGINKLDPLLSEDVAKVHALHVPNELLEATTQTYRYIFWRLTWMRLEEYQRERMDIDVEDKKRNLAIIFGSMTDIHSMIPVLKHLPHGFDQVEVHVVSCHRNPAALHHFAVHGCYGADVVIAAGGKAFALPGVLDALLHENGHTTPVIGVALGVSDSTALEAAKLSISELPGQPVVMDEMLGVYTGIQGIALAIDRAATGEFPVVKRVTKPPVFDVDLSVLAM